MKLYLSRIIILVTLVGLMSLFVNTQTVFAFQEGPEEMTLTGILLWVFTGVGVPVIVGWLNSYVLENISWWHTLSPQVKFIITLAIAGVLPVLSHLFLNWPGLSAVEPWVNMAIQAIVMWLSSQEAYIRIKMLPVHYGIRKR